MQRCGTAAAAGLSTAHVAPPCRSPCAWRLQPSVVPRCPVEWRGTYYAVESARWQTGCDADLSTFSALTLIVAYVRVLRLC